jgi:serine/threonine protein kinase
LEQKQIGRFLLLRPIARGGMAEIYLARQRGVEGFEKLVVIKMLLPQYTRDARFMSLFLNEAKLAARLSHPNIVQIYDLGLVGGTYYIAMEFIHGENLADILRAVRRQGKSLPQPLAVKVVSQVCEGLHYAHTKADVAGNPLKIIHCDISPHNIVVSFEGAVKIIDFGVARASALARREEEKKYLMGKISYLSPEQCLGQALDARTDIFSLGLVLWELLTGRRLIPRSNLQQAFHLVTQGRYPSPREFQPALPEKLEKVVMRALSREPSARFQTAYQMHQALEEVVREQGWGLSSFDLSALMRELFRDKLQAAVVAQKSSGGSPQETVLFYDLGGAVGATEREEDTGSESSPQPALPAEQNPPRPRRQPLISRWRLLLPALLLTALAGALYFSWPWLGKIFSSLHQKLAPELQPAEPGILILRSTPGGARVWLDGEERCLTPCVVENVEVGPWHELEVSLAEYEPFNLKFVLSQPGQQRQLEVPLQKLGKVKWARAQISSLPPGARVELNGAEIPGRTPLTLNRLVPQQTYRLRVFLDGYQDWVTKLKLEPGQNTTVSAALEKYQLQPASGYEK